ncbi:MAG TPA: FAD:protein FMN transferase [Verrucomicrobiae bacterium]|jgi:thiamine biosynthesis lipoprotein
MQTVKLARNAMATRFEIVLIGGGKVNLRAAGEEALDEVDRLEARLSLYRPTSEIARVNAQAASEPVRVSPQVFRLLEHSEQLHRETGGAFDIAIAPLVRCWGFMNNAGRVPDPVEIEQVRLRSGMNHVMLDKDSSTVRFDRDGVMIDLGAIGKGYAIDRAADILREAGVESALLHGGTSTIYGIGSPPDQPGWKVAIAGSPDESRALDEVFLNDSALSVSAVWARSFEADGKKYGHVIDPRSGHPINNAVLSAVALPSATETDALSTALLVLGTEGREALAKLRPQIRTWLLKEPLC